MSKSTKPTNPLAGLARAAGVGSAALGTLAGLNAWLASTVGPLPDQVDGARQQWEWRGQQAAYYTAGPKDAPPLVLVHGHNAAASAWEMREPFRRLGAHYRVYAPDLLGYGNSDRPPLDYSAALYVDFLRDFLREVVRQPTAVLASSVSAGHAIAVAADDPEWITALVLITPVGLVLGRTQNPIGPAVTALFRSPVLGEALFNALVARSSLRYFLAAQCYVNKACVDDDLIRLNYETGHQPGARYAPAAFVGGALFHDVRDSWPRVGQPTLIVWGDQATFTPRSDAAAYLAANPGATLEILSPSSVLPHDELPTEFATVVHAWLEDNRG